MIFNGSSLDAHIAEQTPLLLGNRLLGLRFPGSKDRRQNFDLIKRLKGFQQHLSKKYQSHTPHCRKWEWALGECTSWKGAKALDVELLESGDPDHQIKALVAVDSSHGTSARSHVECR